MTRIFLLVYVGVLAVLFSAWYIHGAVSEQRALADKARVFEEAHGGGARTLARHLSEAKDDRAAVLAEIQSQFQYPLELRPLDFLPPRLQQRLTGDEDVVFFPWVGRGDTVACALQGNKDVIILGPFPDYRLQTIEESLGGWMRLTADEINAANLEGRRAEKLTQLKERFDFPLTVLPIAELPDWPKLGMAGGKDVVFYSPFPQASDKAKWFSAIPLDDGESAVRFGPFPNFEKIEQKAATTTLALVLLPAAIAIALLLRPVAWELRHVENAARTIAEGDLSARVNEDRVSSARTLAEAFNQMAGRTESIVRTQRELVQAVSHELRTPLARMRFAINLIESAETDEERRSWLDSLDTAATDLDELVDELLNYVRLESMEPQLTHEAVGLQETLETLLPKLAGIHPQVEFHVQQTGPAESPWIMADRKGFQRAIGNLLNNAGRHAASEVRVSASESNGFVIVDVDDDGPGIPPGDRQRVLDPFVRLNAEGNHGGTGLGLAIVKRIVTRHGGRVEVMQSPAGGCRIRTAWPRHTSNETMSPSPVATVPTAV